MIRVYNRGIMPQGEWLSPNSNPVAARTRRLYAALFLLAVASVSTLGWFGWKLIEQERLVETQRTREHLEQAADNIAASLRGVIADQGDRLAEWTGPPSGPVFLMEGEALEARGLLYYPYPSALPEETSSTEADAAEFVRHDLAGALALNRQLPTSAGLLGAARVARKLGDLALARDLYRRLADLQVNIAGAPAGLVAAHALCESGGDCAAVCQGLQHGRWHITQPQFEFYSASLKCAAAPEAMALAETATKLWQERGQNTGTRGAETLWFEERPYFVLWRGPPEHRAVMAAPAQALLQQIAIAPELRFALTDAEGRVVAGQKTSSQNAVRATAESHLPWTLFVALDRPIQGGSLTGQQRFLLISLSVMALFLIAGTYLIARAIRKESETMRMQSDFISAVSHEFRTPLTSLRHLSELLVLGRVPSDERRQLYYSTLLSESSRLQRLVEGLLNFGRMEAGARQYHFEEVDAASLAHRVAAEFSPQLEEQGRRIELSARESPLKIEADPEAIRVALRNLVDNALKYSPGKPAVWVDCRLDDHYVAIRVRDQGPGIPDVEKKRIFRRFVRGSAALSTNAKGSGVGLAMVRHIVAAHGGEVTLTSEPGQGSVFTILLPGVKHG